MTLKIHEETDDQRQLTLTVEVPEDRVQKAMRQKARQLGRELRMPGFRRGKVPYRVILGRLGADSVREEAADEMVPDLYTEAIEQVDEEVYGQPSLERIELEPMVLEFKVPLRPQVTLGDYRTMRKEIEEVNVAEEALDQALDQVQSRHAQTEEVDRPAADSDLVSMSGRGELVPAAKPENEDGEDDDLPENDGPEILFDQEKLDFIMDSEKLFPGTSFVENIVGLSAGDDAAFNIVFPDDFEDDELAGREAQFNLTVLNVQSRAVPELDDELAKLEGDFETLEQLRAELKKNLQQQAENEHREALIDETIGEMMQDATFVYPPIAVEMEIDEMVESFKSQISQSGWEFDDYLKINASTESSLREDFRENAEKRLKRSVTLREFVLAEKITVGAEDVDAMIEERLQDFDNEEFRDSLRQFYSSGSGFESISSSVLSEKVYQRIVAILSGTAPSLEELEAMSEVIEMENSEEE